MIHRQLPDNFTLAVFQNLIHDIFGHYLLGQYSFVIGSHKLCLDDHRQFEESKRFITSNCTVFVLQKMIGGGCIDVVFDPSFGLVIGSSVRRPIQLETLHVSCRSDQHNAGVDKAGLIVYSYDDKIDFYLNGIHCRSGYIIIKDTDNIKHISSTNASIVHGKLFKWLFNQEIDSKVVGAGFAYVNSEWKFNSYSMNTSDDGYHDKNKGMHPLEVEMVRNVIQEVYETHRWKQQPNVKVVELKIRKSAKQCAYCGSQYEE